MEKIVTIILRNIPESIRRSLKARAAERGISMQDLALQYIKTGLKAAP